MVGVLLACKAGKEESSSTTTASAAPVASVAAATPSATATDTASAAPSAKPAAKKGKLGKKSGSKALGKGARGGTGASRPSSASLNKTSSRTMGLGDAVTVDPDPCDSLPDRVAECDGKKIYYCQDHNLEMLDCNKTAQAADYTSGDCFESDSAKIADCLGCDVDDDGSVLCCDFGGLICCDDKGNCFDPAD